MSDRKEVTTQTTSEIKKEVKSRRGRKIKYNTDEERIEARRRQQKAYRERKKKELLKLKELVEKNNGLNESLRKERCSQGQSPSKAPKKEQALTEERLQRSLEGQSPEEELDE